MAQYRIDTNDTVTYIEADGINRDEGYLILVRNSEVVAVFQNWNHVVLEESND